MAKTRESVKAKPVIAIVTSLAGMYIAVVAIVTVFAPNNTVILVPIAFAFALLAWIGLHYNK